MAFDNEQQYSNAHETARERQLKLVDESKYTLVLILTVIVSKLIVNVDKQLGY